MYLYTSTALGQVHVNYVTFIWVEDGQPCLNNRASHDDMLCHASLFQHVLGCGI
jgi:hypothetical protein